MSNLLNDCRLAIRALRHNVGFAVTAIAALALGIASTTAIFSVVNKVLLEPLPYPHPEQLVQLVSQSELGNQFVVSIPKYDVWKDHAEVFESIAAFDTSGPHVTLTERESPEALETARVSKDYFHLFGAEIIIGRTFSNEEDQRDEMQVIVISENLWRRRLGASAALVGNTVQIDDKPYKVIGVVSSRFVTEKPVDVWLPLRANLSFNDHISRVRVVGRLGAGVSLETAARQTGNTMHWFMGRYPSAPVLFREMFTVIPLRDTLVGNVRPALLLLTGAVGLVLLIACANVCALVLARASRRTAEIAVRSALGAQRNQLIHQLLTESMMLALGGGIFGLALGHAGVRGLLAVSPVDLPRIGANGSAISLDWRVFLFTFFVSILSGVLFGLIPAVRASRADLMALVKDPPLQSGMDFQRGKSRSLLVISQVAFAVVLLVGAGLLIRTFVSARTVHRGFDERNVVTAQMSLNDPQFERTAQTAQFIRSVEQRVKRISGVSAVAMTSSLPFEPALLMPFTVTRHDQTLVGRYHGVAAWRGVSPSYFETLRIGLQRGRLFSEEDNRHSAPVVVINRMMMRKFWQEVDADPVGEYIVIGKGMGAGLEDIPRQIVGVVGDIREAGLTNEPMMYVPASQMTDGLTARNRRVLPITWVIRTTDDRASHAAIEKELHEASGGLPLRKFRTMHQIVAASSAREQFYVLLLTFFGVTALLLAAVGLYGVMAYSVQERIPEIGLRMALGAAPDNIRNMVVWQGMRLTLIGIGVGIPCSLALSRIVVSLIFGSQSTDIAVLTGVAMLLAVASLIAAYRPSTHAASVNPCESLRH